MTSGAELERLVRRGRIQDVRATLRDLDEPSRKALAPVVKGLGRREVRSTLSWHAGKALAVARVGTVSGAAAVADVLRTNAWQWSDVLDDVTGVLLDRRPPWLPAVVHRLAEDTAAGSDGVPFPVLEALRLATGQPRPTTERYLVGLVASLGTDEEPTDLPALLRRDAELASLVPAMLAADDVGWLLRLRDTEVWRDAAGRLQSRPAPVEQTWPGAITLLAAEGVLDRETVLLAVLEALLRGGKREHVAGLLAVHDALAPTTTEVAAHRRAYVRLLSDGPGTVATAALRLLRSAAGEDLLEVDTVLEAAEGAVRRREKGLATAGLTWLQQLARDRARSSQPVDDVAVTAASALAHERRDVQERALRVLGPMVPSLRPDTLEELRAAALDLPAVLRPDAVAALGPLDAGADGPVAAVSVPEPAVPPVPPVPPGPRVPPGLPVPRAPVDLAPPAVRAVRDLAELSDAVAEHLEQLDPCSGERVLDGVARLAPVDPAGFRDALRPFEHRLSKGAEAVQGRQPWRDDVLREPPVALLLRAVLSPPTRGLLGRAGRSKVLHGWSVPDGVAGCLHARARELAERALAGSGGPLVSAPTSHTGALDPEAVLPRLQVWARQRVDPGALDLEQTLLRLPRDAGDPAWLARVRAVGSRAATWLAGAVEHGLPDPHYLLVPVPTTVSRWGRTMPSGNAGISVVDVRPPAGAPSSLVVRALTPVPPLSLAAAQEWWEVLPALTGPLTVLSTLPQHREAVAAHLLVPLLGTTRQCPPEVAGAVALLPEAGGPTGPATALALGWAAAGSDLAARTAAADALRGFAARGGLDAAAAGRVLGTLLLQPTVSLGRVAATLSDAARGDAATGRLVWGLLAAALPAVLPSGRRGVADLVAVAAEVAAEVGARDVVEGLDAVARPGSTKLATEARRLRGVLAGVP